MEMGGERRRERGKRKVGEGGDERYTKLYTKSKRQKRLYKWYYTFTKPSSGCLSDLTGASGCCTSTFSLKWSRVTCIYTLRRGKEGRRGHAGLESGKEKRERREGREAGD